MGTFSPLKMADSSQPGTVRLGVWTSPSDPVINVSFSSNAKPSYISKAIVTYEQNSILLTPTAVSLKDKQVETPFKDGDELCSFKSLALTYNTKMTVRPAADSIRVTGKYHVSGDDFNEKLNVIGNDTTTIELSLSNGIDKDGAFEIDIPAQSFRNASGYENVALHYTFTIREPRDTFNPLSLVPDTTNILTELTFPITLQFPDTDESFVGTVDDKKMFDLSRLREDGSWTALGELNAVKGENGEVHISNVSAKKSYTTSGVYKIDIPDSIVYNQFSLGHASSRHNASMELIYTVAEPVDPLKEKKDSIALLVNEVDSLLANHAGKLGYPINADTLNAVKDIVVEENDDETQLTEKIESLLGAIKTFYNDTEIVLPTKDNWYTIASVNKDGDKLYLTYANGAVTLSKKTSPYKVYDINDKVAVFETADGKFLHVLMGANDFELTSTTNVTDEKKYINELTLGKMLLKGDDVDQKNVAGLFTIKGSLGLDKDTYEKVGDAYALVVHGENPTIATSLSRTALYFDSDSTSAFRFAETVEPLEEVKALAFIENPVLNSNTQVLTLTIKGRENDEDVTKVSLKSLAGVRFTYKDGDETKYATSTADTIMKAIEGTDNQFEVHVDGLADNNYELLLPAGTFDFSQNPKPVEDTDLSVSFSIKAPPAPVDYYANYGSLPEMWGTIPTLITGFAVADTDLLEVYYYVTDVDVYPNKDATYNIVKLSERLRNVFIAQGHFESIKRDGQYMLKIVYDENSQLADKLPLPNGEYTLTIGRAAYGDENFNKRQNGDTNVAESDCRVNQRVLYNNLTIDNNISGININISGSEELSDGKYIIDGKFIIIKGGKKYTPIGIAL